MESPEKPYKLLHAVAFKVRGLAMVPAFVFIGLCFRWEWEHDLLVALIGLPIFCLGLGLRMWSQVYLRYRIRCDHTLATGGPYVWVRNPVYLGNIVMFGALCVLCELPWAAPLVCAWAAIVYHLSIQFEEARLTKRFGDSYVEYCRRTPRWIPRFSLRPERAEDEKAGLRLAWWAEWHCLLLLLIPVAKEVVGAVFQLE